jgi:hypothetical protein
LEEDQTVKRKRHVEEQIIAILMREREAGMKTADLCREQSVLPQLEGQVRRLAVSLKPCVTKPTPPTASSSIL